MPNNTLTYWEADGQSLHTYAKSITTLSGMGPPQFRGADHTVPLKPGQTWVPKTFDANTITLAMVLRGIAEHATNIDGTPTKAQYQSNWNDLIRMLWKPGQLVSLRKRFYDGGILRQASALVEYKGGLQPTMIGDKASRCTVDLNVLSGVFFDDNLTTEPLVNGNQNITVLGNAPTTRIFVTVNGARVNPKIRNNTAGVEFTYPRTLLAGATVVADVENFGVTDSASPGVDMSPYVTQDGFAQWLVLRPGVNQINVSSTSGTGTVSLQYRAAWV